MSIALSVTSKADPQTRSAISVRVATSPLRRRSSFIELLDAAEAYRDARTSTIELQTDLQVAYYDLLRASGGAFSDETFTTQTD